MELKTKLYLQDPKLSYCSLNAMRTIFDYYFTNPPSRETLKKSLKSQRKVGTYQFDILKTLKLYKFKFKNSRRFNWANITKCLDSNNLILISYMVSLQESHSSVICGYYIKRGVSYIKLCDPWLGYYDIPFSLMKVLINKEALIEVVYFRE